MYSIYEEPFNVTLFNGTETISQDIAPIYLYCAQSAYIGFDMFYTKQQQFTSFNYWVLSWLQNFLGKVFSISRYYQYYLDNVIINDVDVQFFYLGKITDSLMNFDMVVFEEVDEADMDWEQYEPYSRYDDDYFDD